MTVKQFVLGRYNWHLHLPGRYVVDPQRPEMQQMIALLWSRLEYIIDYARQQGYVFRRGSGLTANQIGLRGRISVVIYDRRRYTLINACVKRHSGPKRRIQEGCINFFHWRGQVWRWSDVVVGYIDEQGQVRQLATADPDFASLLQHETDHQRGLLYTYRMRRWWTFWLWRPGLIISPTAPDLYRI